jgi:hypothetical protein
VLFSLSSVTFAQFSKLFHRILSRALCLSHNLRSSSTLKAVKSLTEIPLPPLVVQIAGNALRGCVSDTVRWVVPTGGHVPPACKMSAMEVPNMVTCVAGKALGEAFRVCCSVSDRFAVPLIDLFL